MTESAGTLFEKLLDIMARLRGPSGCPWDREQTRESLKGYLVEESYEVLEAIESGDPRQLREELGDLLFQVVFHAHIAEEQREFTMATLLRGLIDKMVFRHPHVFGDTSVRTANEALAQWEAIKQLEAEREGRRRSVIDGVPRALPSLLQAQRIQMKAARVRFDWPHALAAWDKVKEEMAETADALAREDSQRVREELGDLLFSVVNVARLSGVDAEEALREATEKFRRRFLAMEAALAEAGTSVAAASPDELERSWESAKAREQENGTPAPPGASAS